MTSPRLPYRTLEPGAYTALKTLDDYVHTLGLDPKLLELVKTRASQLNGCAFCTDMHSTDALKAGVPQRQLLALTVWHDSPSLFTAQERAVLHFTEAVTMLAGGVPDDLLNEMRQHFTDAEIVRWTMAVIGINAWNRMGVVAGLEPK